MSADARVKGFIDRILHLKEEQDALAADIREVYAEAKGGGYDKTAMGEVVSYLRKIEKKGKDAVAERGAMFDLYLDAYERPSHAHAREGQSYAEAKGVGPKLIATVATGMQTEIGRKALVKALDIMIEAEETGEITEHEQPETANEIHERPSTNDEAYLEAGPQAEASLAGTGSRMLADREGRSEGEAASAGLPTNSHSVRSSSLASDNAGEVVNPPAASPALPIKQVNPNCRKAARGEQCVLSHSLASCSICANTAMKARAA